MNYNHAPVVLSDYKSTVAGGVYQLDVSKFSADERAPILLDDITFQVVPYPLATSLPSPSGIPTSGYRPIQAIQAKISVGSWELTDDFIYVPVLGALEPQQNAPDQSYWSVVGSSVYFAKWKFPHPMLLPPGLGLNIQLKRRPATENSVTPDTNGAVAFTVYVAAHGKYLDPRDALPKFSNVPYASGYAGAWNKALNISTQFDLRNTLIQPVNMQKIVGYLDTNSTDTVGYERTVTSLVRLGRSENTKAPLVDLFSPWNIVFNHENGVFPANFQLDPGERILAQVRHAATQLGSRSYWYVAPRMAITGWRKEKVI